jgi:phage terminase large subunit-like protein
MSRRVIQFAPQYEQLFLPQVDWRHCVITGGRGSGKSYGLGSSQCFQCNSKTTCGNTLYLRETLVSAHVSIIPEFWEKIELLGLENNFVKTKKEIIHRFNGSQIYFRGIKSASKRAEANLKSVHNVSTVIIDEAQEVARDDFQRIDLSVRSVTEHNRIILSLNPTDKEHWIYKDFFESPGVPEDFNGIVGDTCYIHTTYLDNLDNLPPDFLRMANECKERDIEEYNNIWLGLWRGDTEGALWTADMIDPYRVQSIPADLERVVVAVDPAVTGSKDSDETGIVAVGRKRIKSEMHYFVLDDRSLRASPETWARAVVSAYNTYEADRVVAEVNNGGDLVETMIRAVAPRISFRAVRATRGKVLRAEPVAALYERGLVHHVGNFANLEYQMRNYNGQEKSYSPDRLDALVWGLTALSQSGTGSGAILA